MTFATCFTVLPFAMYSGMDSSYPASIRDASVQSVATASSRKKYRQSVEETFNIFVSGQS
ncbi:hypothetical protein WK61_09395 [Burkholderia ubonensis]|nr:hypothetical protein WK61_09395 [Burkholderia ubonensis]